jgi:hypothetical protein
MRKFLVAVFSLALLALPLMAQDGPRAEVFGGYQYLNTGTINIDGQDLPNSSEGFNGWSASLTGYFTKHLGIEGNFGGGYDTAGGVSTHVYTYTGGPVLAVETGRIKPFVHALFGGIHITGSEGGVSVSRTGFTMMFGGGLDANVSHVFAIRLIQADWLYYHFGSNTVLGEETPAFSQSNNVKIASGIVIRF